MLPSTITLTEVGPREGFQYEGANRAVPITLADKLRLIEALTHTGLRRLQIVSFVHPKVVPHMADAEEICAQLPDAPVEYTGIYLNEPGLRRALATAKLKIVGELMMAASEAFAKRNQNRTIEQEIEAQKVLARTYRSQGIAVDTANIMAAFGCNYEGEVPLSKVMRLIETLQTIAAEEGNSQLRAVNLADTMAWANPEQIRRTVGEVRNRWPGLSLSLHLHDTRGLAVANVYAALLEGVAHFDAAVAGLGGCPFAGHSGAAGNVATEQVVFLCEQLGIETGVELDALLECGRLAERIVGHDLPSRLLKMKQGGRLGSQ